MSQSNLAVQQLNEDPSQSSDLQTQADDSKSAAPQPKTHQSGKQKERSVEQQAEIERIGRIETYVGLQRDENLFTRLNHWLGQQSLSGNFDKLLLSIAIAQRLILPLRHFTSVAISTSYYCPKVRVTSISSDFSPKRVGRQPEMLATTIAQAYFTYRNWKILRFTPVNKAFDKIVL